MAYFLTFLLTIIVVAAVYIVIIYNGFISIKNNVSKAWSNIDVLLKQRYDEIPNLVRICRGYIKHERETLEAVTALRQQALSAATKREVEQVNAIEQQIVRHLSNVYAVVENYPQLKASSQFANLSKRISALEDSIADRRELYNESVTINNIRINVFPDLIVARMFKFKKLPLLEFNKTELALPKMDFL